MYGMYLNSIQATVDIDADAVMTASVKNSSVFDQAYAKGNWQDYANKRLDVLGYKIPKIGNAEAVLVGAIQSKKNSS